MDKNAKIAVVGLGVSGLSIAKWLSQQGFSFSLHDTRQDYVKGEVLHVFDPALPLYLGPFEPQHFKGCTHIFLSPGVDPAQPIFQMLKERGALLKNDISLFGEVANKPIIGITGSNGKSTVTTLTALMLEAAGYRVGVGGNLGTPALDLLASECDVYVLELSSFQLELADQVPFHAVTLLNLSPDHLDRHGTIAAYHAAKQTIFTKAKLAIVNQVDSTSFPPDPDLPCMFFGLNVAVSDCTFGIRLHAGENWLYAGNTPVIPRSLLKIYGAHNENNALAAMALAASYHVPVEAMRAVLSTFEGLPHRAQFILEKAGITWFNDSKGTNTGATLATFAGLSERCAGKIILILGGRGKGEDYAVLETVAAVSRAVLLLGEEAPLIAKAIAACSVPVISCQSLEEVVKQAKHYAKPGDFVLFSPACASFDLFENYKKRGELFMECVKKNV